VPNICHIDSCFSELYQDEVVTFLGLSVEVINSSFKYSPNGGKNSFNILTADGLFCSAVFLWIVFYYVYYFIQNLLLQEGQHLLTGQRAPPISGGT